MKSSIPVIELGAGPEPDCLLGLVTAPSDEWLALLREGKAEFQTRWRVMPGGERVLSSIDLVRVVTGVAPIAEHPRYDELKKQHGDL